MSEKEVKKEVKKEAPKEPATLTFKKDEATKIVSSDSNLIPRLKKAGWKESK